MIIALIVILIAMSAIFSGLTLGMFSLSLNDLERKIKLGNKKAEKIYAIRKNGNFLLCTLNFGNTAINAVVTTLMATAITGGGWIAPVVASVSIFIFAEIMPQAIFSRHAFEVGAKTTWLVRIFMVLMWLVAKPMSMLLDFIFGKEIRERYNKEELSAVLEEHVGESLNQEEQRRMAGAMGFSEKVAFDVMTPTTSLKSIEYNTVLDKNTLDNIRDEHYSRIPVYKANIDNIVGILYSKDLVGYDTDFNKTAGEMCRNTKPLCIQEDDKLSSLWKVMIKERVHLSFVYNEFGSLTGIVSLEDMMEELIGEEIMDESDTVADLQHQARKNNKKTTIIKE
jgi:metal transporter CNNM